MTWRTADPQSAIRHDGFRRDLGLLDSVVVVAGGIVGVGIFANPSNVARIVADPVLILLVWIIGGGVALIGGFVWAELASRFPEVGGQYVYLQRAYPPVVGFLYGIALLFIINGGSLAAVSILFASYVDRSVVPLGAIGIRVAAAAALVALTGVNALGVRAGKRTNNALMAAKVIGMVALVALAFGRGAAPASHFDLSVDRLSVRMLFTALIPILFAYGGWQSCANIAAEIKDPQRNLPRANVLGVLVVVTLYVTMNLAYLWVLTPAQIAASPALASDMAFAAAGQAGARFVTTLIVISTLGFLSVVILTGPRLYYAMAVDGLFFQRAASLHPRYRTPVFALWFQCAVSLVLLTTNTYDQLLSYVVFADWLFFGLTAGALLIVRRNETRPPSLAATSVPARGDGGLQEGRRSTKGTEVARVPGHPWTTLAFVAVAAGVVVDSFVVYPAQSLIGSTILAAAGIAFFLLRR
ncbi:MAG TPA: amino acid permease [Vicinamibacterales bacterium]|nr:amino acid permease [Vicinamibacterales bacterium]